MEAQVAIPLVDGYIMLGVFILMIPVFILFQRGAIHEGQQFLTKSRLYAIIEYITMPVKDGNVTSDKVFRTKVTLITLDATKETKKAFEAYSAKKIVSGRENLEALWNIASRRCVIEIPEGTNGVCINSSRLISSTSLNGRMSNKIVARLHGEVYAKLVGNKVNLNGVVNKNNFPILAYSGDFKVFYEEMIDDDRHRAEVHEFFEDHLTHVDR